MSSRLKSDRREEHRTDMRTLTLTLTVSLFIAMMAFFIILNSFSSASSAKLVTARSSLSNAFGFVGTGQSATATSETGSGGAGDMEQAAATGLRSVLPDLGFQSRATAGGGQIMSVSIRAGDLEERWPALRSRLGELLTDKNQGKRFSLEILALNGLPGTAALMPLAQDLKQDGVDTALVAVGYDNRGQESVELRFIQAGGR